MFEKGFFEAHFEARRGSGHFQG